MKVEEHLTREHVATLDRDDVIRAIRDYVMAATGREASLLGLALLADEIPLSALQMSVGPDTREDPDQAKLPLDNPVVAPMREDCRLCVGVGYFSSMLGARICGLCGGTGKAPLATTSSRWHP